MWREVTGLQLRNVPGAGLVASAALGLIRVLWVSCISVDSARNITSTANCFFFIFAVWMSNTMGLCLLTVKTRSSGWEIPCWIFQLLWTKISLTSKFKPARLFARVPFPFLYVSLLMNLSCPEDSDWSPMTRSWPKTNTKPCEWKVHTKAND